MLIYLSYLKGKVSTDTRFYFMLYKTKLILSVRLLIVLKFLHFTFPEIFENSFYCFYENVSNSANFTEAATLTIAL
jgi:hypothetical protein